MDNQPPCDGIEVIPLGAGRDVGRSCILVSIKGQTVMLDCGMHVGYKDHRRFPDFTPLLKSGQRLEKTISCVLITHFHLDHSAALPYFTEQIGYNGPILMSAPTRAICPSLLEDYRRVMSNRMHAKDMYTPRMIDDCMRKVTVVRQRQTVRIGNLAFTPYYAGHVLGAVVFDIEWVGGGVSRRVVYSGDYNMTAERHLGSANVPQLRPDLLISESTYATTIRGSKKKREHDFLHAVRDCCVNHRKKVLIPVFAVGRIQELALLLEEFWDQQSLQIPIYVSGELAASAHQFYRLFLEWTHPSLRAASLDNTIAASLDHSVKRRRNKFNFQHIKPFDEKYLNDPGPMVVFATPGMLSGGASLNIFKHWAPIENNLLILPGHCVAGTVGDKVLKGEKRIEIDQKTIVEIRCKVAAMSFSAHTDKKGILQMINRVRPSSVVLIHGQERNILKLQEEVERELMLPCFAPQNGQKIQIPLLPGFERALIHRNLADQIVQKSNIILRNKRYLYSNNINSGPGEGIEITSSSLLSPRKRKRREKNRDRERRYGLKNGGYFPTLSMSERGDQPTHFSNGSSRISSSSSVIEGICLLPLEAISSSSSSSSSTLVQQLPPLPSSLMFAHPSPMKKSGGRNSVLPVLLTQDNTVSEIGSFQNGLNIITFTTKFSLKMMEGSNIEHEEEEEEDKRGESFDHRNNYKKKKNQKKTHGFFGRSLGEHLRRQLQAHCFPPPPLSSSSHSKYYKDRGFTVNQIPTETCPSWIIEGGGVKISLSYHRGTEGIIGKKGGVGKQEEEQISKRKNDESSDGRANTCFTEAKGIGGNDMSPFVQAELTWGWNDEDLGGKVEDFIKSRWDAIISTAYVVP